MGLNKKTFLTRSISAVFFVIALLGCLLFSYELFSLFFLVIAIIGAKEFLNISEKMGAKPNYTVVYIASLILYVFWINWQFLFPEIQDLFRLEPSAILLILPFLFLSFALFDRTEEPVKNALYHLTAVTYAVVPMCLLHELVFVEQEDLKMSFEPGILFGIILLIWSNDTFAYLGGSFFGKHKLIERISPGKTIEGTAFGILLSFCLSMLFPLIFTVKPTIPWMALGLIVPILATLGDLIESLLKRSAGIKDSGNILPGHGGVLDRFDSLILVSPALWLIFKISEL